MHYFVLTSSNRVCLLVLQLVSAPSLRKWTFPTWRQILRSIIKQEYLRRLNISGGYSFWSLLKGSMDNFLMKFPHGLWMLSLKLVVSQQLMHHSQQRRLAIGLSSCIQLREKIYRRYTCIHACTCTCIQLGCIQGWVLLTWILFGGAKTKSSWCTCMWSWMSFKEVRVKWTSQMLMCSSLALWKCNNVIVLQVFLACNIAILSLP